MKKHRTLGAPDRTIRMARALRREMSLPEVLLWQQLKQRPGGFAFRKQHPIGRYALDFACIRARLDIEIDSEAHERGDRPERDALRDEWTARNGFATLRITARDVLRNMEGVVVHIVETCRARSRPNPSRNGEVAAGKADGGAGPGKPQSRSLRAAAPGPSALRAPPRSGEELR